jgi:hypothetical protein
MAIEMYAEMVGKFALRGLKQKENLSCTKQACKTIGPLCHYGLNTNVLLLAVKHSGSPATARWGEGSKKCTTILHLSF